MSELEKLMRLENESDNKMTTSLDDTAEAVITALRVMARRAYTNETYDFIMFEMLELQDDKSVRLYKQEQANIRLEEEIAAMVQAEEKSKKRSISAKKDHAKRKAARVGKKATKKVVKKADE